MFLHTTLKLRPKSSARVKDPSFVVTHELFKQLWREVFPRFRDHDSLGIEFGDDAGTWCWSATDDDVDETPIGEPFIYVTIASLLHERDAHGGMRAVDSMFAKFEELLVDSILSEADFRIESSATLDPSTTIDIQQER